MSAFLLLDISFSLLCISASALLYSRRHPQKFSSQPRGYILENKVTHARLLPLESSHAFTYPTVSLLLSLDALEAHSLDLYRGWVFGYGGLWGRIIGLRSDPYLTAQQPGGHQTIRGKLEALLAERGFMDGRNALQDAWMMTMPSFMGFEGINPLTVYFCYKSGQFWLTVLEIHNTFGETHVHVLEIGKEEDTNPPKGYDHQWTFLREFHVSPFNDRSGYYVISIKSPTHTPMDPERGSTPPKPTVRIHLHAPSSSDAAVPGDLKLTALLRPTTARPLDASSLFVAIARTPFSLLLSFPRILAEAWKLHYRKRLDVHIRPEPLPIVQDWAAGMGNSARGLRFGGGVKWLSEGLLERYARWRFESFLDRRVNETGVTVTLVAADPTIGSKVFSPSSHERTLHLRVWYLSPRFFTIMFLCPSAAHALLLGSDSEGLFFTSSRELFLSTFSVAKTTPVYGLSSRQHLRTQPIPGMIRLSIPLRHIFDDDSVLLRVSCTVVIWAHSVLELLEARVFSITRARVVSGEEPWKQWERAVAKFRENQASIERLDT